MRTHKACIDPECARAGQLLPLEDFFKDRARLDERQSICKECSHKRQLTGWVPYHERREPHPFELTSLHKNLNLTMTCMGMVRQPLTELASELLLKADTKQDKETYEWARSMLQLVQQIVVHVDWIMDRKLKETDDATP